MQVNQTPIQSPIQSPMFTRISTRKTRRFASSKASTSKAVTALQRKAAKASGLALLFKIIFG